MAKEDVAFLERIWIRLATETFSKEILAQQVFKDGGIDMSRLSEKDILSLIEGRFDGDWHKPAFSFSELLTYYAACGKDLKPQQIVGWVFAAFVISDAIKHDATEWERQFNFFMAGFLELRSKLEIDETVEIFHRVFQ